jgi:inositol-1,3,4-trisphosphate 5/6-kinase/inositol-tetrakisphosphate 1-kinase
MLIALQESAFVKLPSKSIVQEFVNHDATLFKVYVLGDFVSVYERHSLPNLPSDLSKAAVDLVEFDSQRPYPKLSDFGLGCIDTSNFKKEPVNSTLPQFSNGDFPVYVPVTAEEVRPIVDVLKEAFGLELFGFDILRSSDDGEWLVVDVNYFPSYKEVPNFPSLLARYLTQRVLDQRRQGTMGRAVVESRSSDTTERLQK